MEIKIDRPNIDNINMNSKNQKLTIIMYHYVRPIFNSNFPKIKGLELNSFYRQLDYLQENYTIVDTEDVINAVISKKKLPPQACWLTFDDGYKDHIKYVMPELVNRKISGAFFPTRCSALNLQVLNINFIHYILSCANNIDELINDLNFLCIKNLITEDQLNEYYKIYGTKSRYDDAKTIYVKRMLQHVLPEEIRDNIISILFKKYVGISEKVFSKELYMNKCDISELIKNNMYVGSHGSTHQKLALLDENKQSQEIIKSLDFLESVGAPTSDWIMCYPHGSYNETTLALLKKFNASIGLTTKVHEACVGSDNPHLFPRVTTHDFPK